MPETMLDVRHLPNEEAYRTIDERLRLTLGGITDSVAILDIDSDRIGTFDDRDASSLEPIVSILASPATEVSSAPVAG